MTNKSQKALNFISNILNQYEDAESTQELILEYIQNIFENEKTYVFFISPNGLYLKSSVGCTEEENFMLQKVNEMGILTRKFVKEQKTLLENTQAIVKEMGLKDTEGKTFLVSPLKIKSAIFGVLVLEKYGVFQFDKQDIEILDVFSAVSAYVIKDAELSDVFKIQLKILQENIIEKTEAVQVIKEKNKQIMEANQVKDEFLANISHELRTPLNAIVNSSDALKMEVFGELNPKQKEYINDINASAIHLSGLINEILDMSKIEAHQMFLTCSDFIIASAIDEVVNVLRSSAEKKSITFKKNYSDIDAEIHADFKKFQQIFYNLISNAIKYTPDNGQVEIGFSDEDDNYVFYIKDNGIGIDEKYHGKIFAKFQQIENIYTKNSSSTGLGLAITKEFVEMHNGRIYIESKVGEGSTFVFEIPKNI